MKKLSLFLLMGMLFALNSCEDSLDSLEESRLTGESANFVTFEGPDGKVITEAIPEELQQESELAQSRMMCTATVTNTNYNKNTTLKWNGVSVNGKNLIVPAGGQASISCPCSGYIWLVTSGSGRSITWEIPGAINDDAGSLPLSNGMTYQYY